MLLLYSLFSGFNLDDRFLSESLLRKQWNSNREESDINIVEPRTLVGPGPKSPKREESEPLDPGKERGLSEPGPFEHRQESVPSDPKGLETRPLDPKPVDPRDLENRSIDSKPLDSGHLELKNQTSTRSSSPNASSKILMSHSVFLVLVYFCLESFVLI